MVHRRHRLPVYGLSLNCGVLRRVATKSEIQKYVSAIDHSSAGGMSRKTYSKKCTGLEKMRG